VIAMPTHLATHKWSLSAIDAFIANGGVCRRAKTSGTVAAQPPAIRRSAHA
jgi:hypothetical protein